MAEKIRINVSFSARQAHILKSLRRFNIIRCGRRFGKTFLATYHLLKFALSHPNSLSWYVCSDISTCVELAMPEFEKMCPPELIRHKNRQSRTYTLFNGARISWKTGETADSLRGRGLDLVILEECAFWSKGRMLWHDVIRPQLSGRGKGMGNAIFVSSPNGSNWFRQLENQVKNLVKAGSTEWAVFTGTISDNPLITPEEIETLRESTPDLIWRQEYLGDHVDEIGLVYWEFDKIKSVIQSLPKTLQRATNVRGLDWGLNDNTACVWMSALDNRKIYVYDEYSHNNLDVPSHARIIQAKTIEPIRHTCLDASCWNRDASMTSVAKRFSNANIPVLKATRDLDGSLSDLKALVAKGDILIDAKCKNLINALEVWQYGQHEIDILAAFRYGAESLIRMGLVLVPLRVAKPRTFEDVLKEDAECERRRRACEGNKHLGGLSMKVYNWGG